MDPASVNKGKPMYVFDPTISSAVQMAQTPVPKPQPATGKLSSSLLQRMHRYWQAANYLTIGQIYLKENPLLHDPLRREDIKPRLLGHWGTSPGLSLIYVHLNRLITEHDLDMIFLAGPGHGGPAVLANLYLEGTYSEIYPTVSRDSHGLNRLFRQFSTPGGVPSHVSVPTPGSIHEGGELGYVLAHAFGAVFDNPDLIAAAVIGDGEAETGGYLLTGRHGLYVTYEAFGMISASMTIQYTKWLEEAGRLPWRAAIASLNILLSSTCWRNDHNGFSHQGPDLVDVVLSKRGTVARIYLPPDANSLLAVTDHCLRSRNRVNLIVIDKQPQLQWLDLEQAREHFTRGTSCWEWASTPGSGDPDVILGACGDIPTMEIVAAAWWLRRHAPELRVRVVNVIDLMSLFSPEVHPHGLSASKFAELFTFDSPVIFAFHGYQRALHAVLHGRPNPGRFHVRGFNEQGTTTTPFNMVVLNGMSRYQLAAEALRRVERILPKAGPLILECKNAVERAVSYSRMYLEDPPDIQNWTWTD